MEEILSEFLYFKPRVSVKDNFFLFIVKAKIGVVVMEYRLI